MMPFRFTRILLLICAIFSTYSITAQEIKKGNTYTIAGIEVVGLKSFNEQTVVTTTGLRIGQEITIPGEELADVEKKLWGYDLFNKIDIYAAEDEENPSQIYLQIRLTERPAVSQFKIVGIKERKQDEILKDIELKAGKKVTQSYIANTKNYLLNKYKKQGFANVKVNISTKPDTAQVNSVKMLINVDKGEKVKVSDINFIGNEQLSSKKLRSAMKNTKQKSFFRFWKKSKYIPEDYDTDLVSVVDKYKENGYRDARILSDTVIYNDDNTLTLNLNVEEGDKYYFGDINFVGNTVYSDETLHKVLGINKGDTYNGVLLKERIADVTDPDADDITNLYQNSGYLFSTVNPVEISAKNDTIDFEIRIIEGKPAYFDRIMVSGNDRTNDHVIYRELRTRPGDLYQKTNVVRTVRELSQLGFFDPEQISPEIKNANPNAGTVDVEYKVVEKGSSQVQLQGGYGGGGFIGTLGLSFANFSLRNILNKEAYKPLPMGDGQSLSLRLQASKYYQTYSFSFSEPWFGGKEPRQFSVSFNHTQQYRYNYYTQDVDKSQRFLISGVSVGLSKRLKVPDDYFYFSQALSFQHYNLKNYNSYLFTFGDGYSNSLAYTIGLSRKSSGPNPIFPMTGSDFSVSAKLSLPYSLFDGRDYSALAEERDELADSTDDNDVDRVSEIDQMRFDWLEFYKVKFSGYWYTNLIDKLVLKSGGEFGFLGSYNSDRGVIPFERFFVGGDGMANYTLDGRENVQLRGYQNQSLSTSSTDEGSVIYNKFSLELRYPITLKQQASIYGLTFLEGGAAFNNFRDFNPFQLKRSAGVGLRIFMPAFGLLGIDFGYGFDSVDGTNQPSGWQTHFVIGQQF
ncbi:outer membrane protein assembly factor BamA [Pustulibacterium marinum]|nr:outer membrane protein assembly factor BamA [Pustulibacterium marinum]